MESADKRVAEVIRLLKILRCVQCPLSHSKFTPLYGCYNTAIPTRVSGFLAFSNELTFYVLTLNHITLTARS